MAYFGHLREDDVISPTHDACLINRDCSRAGILGVHNLNNGSIVAPLLSVVASCSHIIQSLQELVSGQCRPLILLDKGFTKFIKFCFDITMAEVYKNDN